MSMLSNDDADCKPKTRHTVAVRPLIGRTRNTIMFQHRTALTNHNKHACTKTAQANEQCRKSTAWLLKWWPNQRTIIRAAFMHRGQNCASGRRSLAGRTAGPEHDRHLHICDVRRILNMLLPVPSLISLAVKMHGWFYRHRRHRCIGQTVLLVALEIQLHFQRMYASNRSGMEWELRMHRWCICRSIAILLIKNVNGAEFAGTHE